jgi:hypothetical protein
LQLVTLLVTLLRELQCNLLNQYETTKILSI